MGEGYVVAIKPSARRASRAVGEWVAEHGAHREFDSKALAGNWARVSSPKGRTLWVQDAHPLDDGPADGYLLARRTPVGHTAAVDRGEQVVLDDE